MKLRICNDSIRLRLSVSEVALIGTGRPVVAISHLPGDRALKYSVEPTAVCEPDVAFLLEPGGAHLRVQVPHDEARTWAETPQLVSLQGEAPLNGGALSLLVEKDFACLAPRAGDDASDLFVNPLADESFAARSG